VVKKPIIPKVYPPKERRSKFAVGFWIVVAVFLAVLVLSSCRWRFPFSIETGI
jgi:hypothetical protein